MQSHFLQLVVALLCFIFNLTACSTHNTTSSAIMTNSIANEIDQLVRIAMQELKVVPGFALSIYTPGGNYVRGFGVTDIETNEAVSGDTAFYIASTTKAFTALALNSLHHQGKLDLDSNLSNYAPEIDFPATIHPDKVTLRSLLTHTSGISNNPLVFRNAYSGQHNPEINSRLLKATTINEVKPLGHFQYTNAGYNILTTLSDKKLNMRWQDLLAKEIFQPVGMLHTTAYISTAINNKWSLAQPHDGSQPNTALRARLNKMDSTMQSAGGLIMSANDALRWLELLVEDGMIDGSQVIPQIAIHETRTHYATVGDKRRLFTGDLSTRDHYGLGWYIGKYRNDLIIEHGGAFGGFHSQLSYMPDHKIGVAALVNANASGKLLAQYISSFVYDRLTGRKHAFKRAQQNIKRLLAEQQRIFEATAADKERRTNRKWELSKPFSDYVGTYENQLYGTIKLSLENNKPIFTLGAIRSEMEAFPLPDHVRIDLAGRGIVGRFLFDDNDNLISFLFRDREYVVQFDKQ